MPAPFGEDNGRYKHGGRDHPLYRTWQNMIARCENPTHENYENYGARGIAVCEEWHNPLVYYAWCESQGWVEGDGLTTDRIKNDYDYYPENCRRVTQKVQQNNKRQRVNATSGHEYISWFSLRQGWRVIIGHRHYGSFKTLEEAIAARDAALAKIKAAEAVKFMKDPITGIFKVVNE